VAFIAKYHYRDYYHYYYYNLYYYYYYYYSYSCHYLSLQDDMDATVEAGVGYVELNEALGKDNLFFPLDPGPGATLGGM